MGGGGEQSERTHSPSCHRPTEWPAWGRGQRLQGQEPWPSPSWWLLGRWVTEGQWVRVTCAPWCGGEPLGDRHWGTPDRGEEGTQNQREVKGVSPQRSDRPRWTEVEKWGLALTWPGRQKGATIEVSRPPVASTFHGTAAISRGGTEERREGSSSHTCDLCGCGSLGGSGLWGRRSAGRPRRAVSGW